MCAMGARVSPPAALTKAETGRQHVARSLSFRREECSERGGHRFRALRKALESLQRGDKGNRHHRRQPQVRSDRTPPPSAHRSVATHGTAPRSVEIGTRHAGESKGRGLTKSRRGRSAMHRSEEHTSELQSLMRNSYAVFCLKKKKSNTYTSYMHIRSLINM